MTNGKADFSTDFPHFKQALMSRAEGKGRDRQRDEATRSKGGESKREKLAFLTRRVLTERPRFRADASHSGSLERWIFIISGLVAVAERELL